MIHMQFIGNILDVIGDIVFFAEVTVEDGVFKSITPLLDGSKEANFEGIMVPGFIDSHIHIESSMLTPAQFAKVAVRHGTTSVVCDPHEIANVDGLDAVNFMIDNAKTVPFDFYFTAPSCVPATFFETSGAILDDAAIKKLLDKDEVVALGEMMNFPGVIARDEEVLKKLELADKYLKPIDGHAPALSDGDLDNYLSNYFISTDHECSTFDEAIEKKQKGMKIMVRDASSAKNLENLLDFSKRINYWKEHSAFGKLSSDVLEQNLSLPIFDFIVSDDKDPSDLLEGHLNKSVKKAIELEVDPIKAIEMVTINPANHYSLNSGAILEDLRANFAIVDSLENLNVLKTYVGGECVFDGENVLFDVEETSYKNTFNVSKKDCIDFEVVAHNKSLVNVIKSFNGELTTEKIQVTLDSRNGFLQPDLEEDILKISVVERYGGNTMANAFINGFGLKKGAIASSVSHDSHNIVVVGTNSKDMAESVNLIIENKGGLAIVNGEFKESLALPIAGLMSNDSCEEVASKLKALHRYARELGCKLDSPFMTMSFMALLVIPSLKLSNKGLFDVDNFSFIDLIQESFLD